MQKRNKFKTSFSGFEERIRMVDVELNKGRTAKGIEAKHSPIEECKILSAAGCDKSWHSFLEPKHFPVEPNMYAQVEATNVFLGETHCSHM